ncbi:MAG: hypothetical protein ACRCXL_01055, partial [Dermatophilaceae bacterium]
ASLVTRAGVVDETLPTTGWTHLAEHLALHDRDRGTFAVNGSVSLTDTRLLFHGEPDEVTAVLAGVTAWLRAPRLDRVADESRVLRAEAEFRGSGDAAVAMLQRYGAGGAGLAGYTEPGLGRVTPEDLAGFVTTRFTRGNSVLVLDGPPPAGLRLDLPDGERMSLPSRPATRDPRPAAYPSGARLVLSGEVPRTPEATFLPWVLQDMLRRDLRENAGGAYAPWSAYEPVDPDVTVVLAGSDVAESLLPTVMHWVRSGVETMRSHGILAGVVEDAVASALMQLRDPYAVMEFAERAAAQYLQGLAVQEPAEVLDEVAAVTRDGVAALVAQFADTLLLGVPSSATWSDEYPTLRMPSHREPLAGTRFRSRDFPVFSTALVVGDSTLEIGESQSWQRVAFDDVAGMLATPDGARQVISREGWGLAVEPTMWSGGPRAVELLDLLVPPEKHIPVAARDAASVPQPLPVWRRWHGGVSRWEWTWQVFVLVIVLGLVVARIMPARTLATVAVIGAFTVWYQRRQEARHQRT